MLCNLLILLVTGITSRKTIFSFSRRPEKVVFLKKLAGIWSFLYYREWTCFFFSEIWSYTLNGKWKMIFLKKNTEIRYFLQTFCKDGIFSPKTWYFSLGRKWEMTFLRKYMEIWYFLCTCTGVTNMVPRSSDKKKKSKIILSRKNTPKGDWRSRLTS